MGGGGGPGYDVGALDRQQTVTNRPNSSSVFGSSTWSGGDPIYGPTGQVTGYGPWKNTQSLSPYGQQRFNLGSNLMGQAASELKPLDTSSLTPWGATPQSGETARKAAEDALYGKAQSRLDPQWGNQEAALRGQLAAQGLHPGDAGYEQQMKTFQQGRTDAYGQAQKDSVIGGLQEQTGQFGMQLQGSQYQDQQRMQQIQQQLQASGWTLGQINALMAGVTGGPQPDLNAGASNIGTMGMQQNQINMQQQQQGMNNLVGGGSAIIGAAAMMSDVDAKEDFSDPTQAIEEFLEASEPSEYSYRPEHKDWGSGRYVSPMAQGLERSRLGRDLVVDTPGGKIVDYGKGFGAILSSLHHVNRKLNTVMGL